MKSALFVSILGVLLLSACGGTGGEKLTPNGFTYVKHTNSTDIKPNAGDYAYVHVYVMYDDSLVNTTRERNQPMPIVIPDYENTKPEDMPGGKPNPLIDVLSVMAKGDSASVNVPIDSMMAKNPQLQGVEKLVYNVIIEDVKTEEEFKADQEAERQKQEAEKLKAAGPVVGLVADIVQKYGAGELDSKIKTLPSGLKYQILEPGTGERAANGKSVEVNYYGTLTNGKRFDDSFSRNRPFSFELGKGAVIKGWDEGIAQLKEGAKAVLFVPADLAYGSADRGTIPPNSELIFYVELLGVK